MAEEDEVAWVEDSHWPDGEMPCLRISQFAGRRSLRQMGTIALVQQVVMGTVGRLMYRDPVSE